MKIAVTGPVCKDTIIIDGVIKECIGGSIYYEACVLKMFGVDVKVFGTYAKADEEFVRENFKGIEVKAIYAEKTITHELTYAKENPDVRKTKVPEYSSNTFPVEDNLLKELKSFDYVFLGPLYYENLPFEFFKKMKGSNLVLNNFGLFTYYENGVPIRKNPENLAKVARFLKYLFLDEGEMKYASQKETIEEGAGYFLNLGVKVVIVTRGSKGSIVFTKDKKYKIPAYPPKKLVDPTGAGDTYLAAFIYSKQLSDDLQKRGEFAAMAATMVIEKTGAFDGSLEEVKSRLKLEGVNL
jgi:sugar/nucleoside kinase (ribokinase family)